MVSIRTKLMLVFGGTAGLAIGAIVALRAGAMELATALLGTQILFAGVCLRLVCHGTWRRLKALQGQVEAGGPVAADGECEELARAVGKLIESQHAALESRDQQVALVLQAEARTRHAAQAVIDGVPHGIALLSPEGRVELVNARGMWFGLEKGKSVDGAPYAWIKELLTLAVKTRQRAQLRCGNCQGGEQGGEPGGGRKKVPEGLVQIFEEGRELFFFPQAHPQIDTQGMLTGVVLVVADVTDDRQAYEARMNLLSSFSHEIRTPLTSLQMSIYLLLDDASNRLTPRQLELLKAARDDTDRLHRIIEEALAKRYG